MQAGGLPVHGEGGWAQPQSGLLAEGQWTRTRTRTRRRLGSLQAGALWFHLLYSVVVDVDFVFFLLHEIVKYFPLVPQDQLSFLRAVCVRKITHNPLCY